MNYRSYSQRGQAIVLITLSIVGLIAITGLAVDGGSVLADRRQAQNTADTVALSAALRIIDGNYNQHLTGQTLLDYYKNPSFDIAETNGYAEDQVTINNPPQASCNGTIHTYTSPDEYIQVIIRSDVNAHFAPIVGVDKLSSCVEAVSHAQPPVSGEPFMGNAVVALSSSGTGLSTEDTSSLNAINGGVFVNSSDPSALLITDSSDISGDKYVVGGAPGCSDCDTGIAPFSQGYINAFLASVPPPPLTPGCPTGTPGEIIGNTVSPGDFPGIQITSGSWTFGGGVYCVTGSIQITNATVNTSSTTSDVFMVMGNHDIAINTANVYFRKLEVYTTNGSLNIQASSHLYTNRLRFISRGSGNFIVGANSTVKDLDGGIEMAGQVKDAYCYFEKGRPEWEDVGKDNSGVYLHAPPAPNSPENLLVYMPKGNDSTVVWGGTADPGSDGGWITGSFLAPNSTLIVDSFNDQHTYHGQIIFNIINFINDGELWADYKWYYEANTSAAVELVK